MNRSPKCSLATLLLILSACSPACTSVPEAGPPETKGGPVGGGGSSGPGGAGPAPSDSAAPQPAATDIHEAKGVDLSRLSDAQKTSFYQLVNSEPSACGKPHSLAVSLRDDPSCRDSLSVSQFIADALAAGASPSDIKANLDYIVSSLQPRKIDIEGRPVYGNERAPVTVVVFADFECPHCRAEAPVLRQAVDQFRGRAKLVFKHFPLEMHPRAKVAAVATVAAQAQGKFWEMHDIVFANQTALSDADLRRYAQKIGLDMARFDADFAALKGKALVDADRADGEKLEITGTPAVFVNGRYYNEYLFGGTVVGWIDDALRR